jgi:hypothetical protein
MRGLDGPCGAAWLGVAARETYVVLATEIE